jgi:hypothetical protein
LEFLLQGQALGKVAVVFDLAKRGQRIQ